MGQPESPSWRRRGRQTALGAVGLALIVTWFALAKPSGHPANRPSPTASNRSLNSPPTVFTVAQFRLRGRNAGIAVYRDPKGAVCLESTTRDTVPCDIAPKSGQTVRLVYSNWVYLDATGYGFGLLLIGAISPDVTSVRVSLGKNRWIRANIVSLPDELKAPFRLFYVEKRTSFESLNRSLPVVAEDSQEHELGRTSYLVRGG